MKTLFTIKEDGIPFLKILNLSSNGIDFDTVKYLSLYLNKGLIPNIEMLNLSENNIKASGTDILFSSLMNCTKLFSLDISSFNKK